MRPLGIEPSFFVLQTNVSTNFTKAAEPPLGIEPKFSDYETDVLPLYYGGIILSTCEDYFFPTLLHPQHTCQGRSQPNPSNTGLNKNADCSLNS